MENVSNYFILLQDVELVSGANRSAIYDLNSGDVYSIDSTARKLVESLIAGKTIKEASEECDLPLNETLEYLQTLVMQGVGAWSDQQKLPRSHSSNTQKTKAAFELEFIWLELTVQCNLQCLHCYSESSPLSKKRDQMKHDDWVKVITDAAYLGCRKLQFIGGEPFLYGSRLFELADCALELNFEYLEVFTNATLIDEASAKRLHERNMSVAISLYGATSESHDSVTRVNGSFSKTIANLKLLRSLGIPVRVAIIAMSANEQDVANTADFAKKSLGISEINVDIVRSSGRGCGTELYPSKAFCKQFELWSPNFGQVDIKTFEARNRGHNCFSTNVCATATGDVYPCIMEKKCSIGNVIETSLSLIWKSDRAFSFQGLTKDSVEMCKDCEYRYACFDCGVQTRRLGCENSWSKPTWCHYDPYSGIWEEQAK